MIVSPRVISRNRSFARSKPPAKVWLSPAIWPLAIAPHFSIVRDVARLISQQPSIQARSESFRDCALPACATRQMAINASGSFMDLGLVAEQPLAGEDHRDAMFVGGGDDFGILYRASGLRNDFDTRF